MARHRKARTVCALPDITEFNAAENGERITLTVDELETIRLIDYTGMTQKECARQMGVARTTVTSVYDSARRKIADAVINRSPVVIDGGDYTVCKNSSVCCGRCGESSCGRCRNGDCELCTGIFRERGKECFNMQ